MAKPDFPREMFDLWQKMFAPAGMPMHNLMFPDLKEVEKKIAELETVESWLKANVSMVQMSIKSLEYQRAMLKGGEKAKAALTDPAAKDKPALNPAQWAWDMMAPAARPAKARKRKG
jgi:hypothetical protein